MGDEVERDSSRVDVDFVSGVRVAGVIRLWILVSYTLERLMLSDVPPDPSRLRYRFVDVLLCVPAPLSLYTFTLHEAKGCIICILSMPFNRLALSNSQGQYRVKAKGCMVPSLSCISLPGIA